MHDVVNKIIVVVVDDNVDASSEAKQNPLLHTACGWHRLSRIKVLNSLSSTEVFRVGISACLLYTSPSPRDATLSRMPSSA